LRRQGKERVVVIVKEVSDEERLSGVESKLGEEDEGEKTIININYYKWWYWS